MKSTLYILLFCLGFSINLSAQKYNTMLVEDWKNGIWIGSLKMTNTFDGLGNIVKVAGEQWNDTTKVWEKNSATTYNLNANSTINNSLTQIWIKAKNEWQDMQKTIYTYDASKNVLTEKTQMFFISSWLDYSLSTNTYTGSKLTKNVTQQLDFMSMQLKIPFKQRLPTTRTGLNIRTFYKNGILFPDHGKTRSERPIHIMVPKKLL